MAFVRRRLSTEVARYPQVSAAIEKEARDILDRAQALADQYVDSGAYKRSLYAKLDPFKGVQDWVVGSSDPGSVFIEHGTSDTPARKIITKAAFGGRS